MLYEKGEKIAKKGQWNVEKRIFESIKLKCTNVKINISLCNFQESFLCKPQGKTRKSVSLHILKC
jgi:hypothetical protein